MPLVFPSWRWPIRRRKVSDPAQRIAAANGQFLLMEREAYRRLGGHASVADKVLEDVELAFAGQAAQDRAAFSLCAGCGFSTRMYRTTGAMIEGWTKNLALLFNNALATGVLAGAGFFAAFWVAVAGVRTVECAACDALAGVAGRRLDLRLLWLRTLFRFYARVAKSNFPFVDCADCAAGTAAVCGAAVPELVSASGAEAGKLEGAELRRRE